MLPKGDSFVGRKNFTMMRSQILQVIITILIDVKMIGQLTQQDGLEQANN